MTSNESRTVVPSAAATDPLSVTLEPPSGDPIWCDIRGVRVDISECATSCAAPEQRPVCWMGKIYRDEPMEGGSG